MVWVCASRCRLCCLDRPLRVRLPAPQMAHLKTNTFPVPRGPKGNGACFITVNRQALVPFSLSAKQSNRSPSLRNPNNQHQEGKILRNLWAQNQNLDASTCICTLHCHCEHVKSFWFSTFSWCRLLQPPGTAVTGWMLKRVDRNKNLNHTYSLHAM